MGYKKFIITELADGTALRRSTETTIVTDDVKFDDNMNLTQKLETIVAGSNFSYDHILSSEIVTVPSNQQMIVYDEVEIEGELVCDGSVIVSFL